jgi:sec-independent protein translocase protein TatB
MFDIAFSELLVIAVIALLVIGPERLPKVARTAGHLFGRLQRYVNDVKADIQREVELDELRKLRSQFEDAAKSVEQEVNRVDQEVRAATSDLDRTLAGDAPGGASATPESTPEPAPALTAEGASTAPPETTRAKT